MAKGNNPKIEIIGEKIPLLPVGNHLVYGTFFGPITELDFRDANIPELQFGQTPQEREVVRRLLKRSCEQKYDKTLEAVAQEIMQAETTFNLEEYTLSTSAMGARSAIASVLTKLVQGKRNIVLYASPNWIFEQVISTVPDARGGSFYANSGDSFVQACEDIGKEVGDKIAAVIIVDPANPRGYRLSRQHTQYLEELAEKNGYSLVFDDVFRGLQVKESKDTAAMHTKNSIIIETTSKRFGARGAGVTWTLVPKRKNIELEETIHCEGCKNTAAYLTDALFSLGYGERVQAWIRANAQAFMAGYKDAFDGPVFGSFVQAFPESPILTLEGITDFNLMWGSDTLRRAAAGAVAITSGLDWIKDITGKMIDPRKYREELVEGLSYVRICPTKESPDRCYLGGFLLGQSVASRAKTIEKL